MVFDPQLLGQTSEQVLTITNSTSATHALSITPQLSSNYQDFELWVGTGLASQEVNYVDPAPSTLAPSETLTLRVVFMPEAQGEHIGTLHLTHDDGDLYSPLQIDLWGIGATGEPKRYYYFKDHLGSVRATVNEDGNVVDSRDYYPFGMQMADRGVTGGDLAPKERYTGHELDEETDLYYAGARYLDPVIGRWLAIDPLADDYPSLSPYNYVANNPIVNYDPDGRSIWTKLVKATVKVTKAVSKNGFGALKDGATYADAFSGIVGDARTAFDGSASFGDRALAVASLASEALPVSIGDVKDGAKLIKKVVSGSDEASDAMQANRKVSTLQPGPHAGESIPARGPGRNFTPEERAKINEIGQTTGCHTCGATDPGTKSGNFVPDHQPPNQLNPDNEAQRLYPHCISCSRRQGGQIRTEQRRKQREENQ